jgi:N-acetylmuramoyl-L-alanine amidase
MKIYLTAGHNVVNGRGTGAFGVAHPKYPNGFDEAAEAIVLRDLVTTELRLKGLNVVNDSNDTALNGVLTWLRNTAGNGDLCIEIHFNALPGSATGVECVVANDHSMREGELARALCRAVNEATGVRIRNRAPGRGGVIFESETARGRIGYLHSPAVAYNALLEVCFCTSKQDVDKYFANRNQLAKTLAAHIIWWL